MLSNGEFELKEQNDSGLFEGDIMLTEAQKRMIMSGDITSYSGIEGGQWPDGIIPYVIVRSVNDAHVYETQRLNKDNLARLSLYAKLVS